MNLKTVAAFVSENTTTLTATFDGNNSQYTFKCPISLAVQLKEGDKVIAETAKGLQIVTVYSVHGESSVSLDSGLNYKWVFAKVPMDVLKSLNEEEDNLVMILKEKQRSRLRQEVLNSLGCTSVKELTAKESK